MASPNAPVSSEILYLRHSKARVLVSSAKQFITGYDSNGLPKLSRALDIIRDVIVPTARKMRNQ